MVARHFLSPPSLKPSHDQDSNSELHQLSIRQIASSFLQFWANPFAPAYHGPTYSSAAMETSMLALGIVLIVVFVLILMCCLIQMFIKPIED